MNLYIIGVLGLIIVGLLLYIIFGNIEVTCSGKENLTLGNYKSSNSTKVTAQCLINKQGGGDQVFMIDRPNKKPLLIPKDAVITEVTITRPDTSAGAYNPDTTLGLFGLVLTCSMDATFDLNNAFTSSYPICNIAKGFTEKLNVTASSKAVCDSSTKPNKYYIGWAANVGMQPPTSDYILTINLTYTV